MRSPKTRSALLKLFEPALRLAACRAASGRRRQSVLPQVLKAIGIATAVNDHDLSGPEHTPTKAVPEHMTKPGSTSFKA